MPPNGKFAQGLRGFPTPNSIPADGGYIVFRIPADNEYAGLILGAAQLLTYAYNWYQWGDLTPDEAADAFRLIVNQAPYENCGCTLPGGTKIIRIGAGGHFEELGEDGEWHEPTGDYAIPPVPQREGGTPDDQMCLAAANAVNVLEQLYEQLSDDWAEGVSTAQAATNFVLAIGALIAAPFGLIGEAIIIIAGLVFNVLYETLEFIGADLWDENFTEALKCIFFGCASNDDGVVTFDFECINNELAAQTNAFDLTSSQLRLFGQIQYIFSFIGVDGLNSAGGTTAILTADCSGCAGDCDFTVTFDPGQPFEIISFGAGTSGFSGQLDNTFGEPAPSIQSTLGLDPVPLPGFGLAVEIELPSDMHISGLTFRYNYFRNDGDILYVQVNWLDSGHGPISQDVQVPTESQNEWHGIIMSLNYDNVRYVQIRVAGSGGDFEDGGAWIDNVCINPV